MNRRHFMTMFAILGSEGLLHAAQLPPSRGACAPADVGGWEVCEATACTFNTTLIPETQHAENWCWAACIEMAFGCLGHGVRQEQIVKSTWGRIVDVPETPSRIIDALNREYIDGLGIRFRVRAELLISSIVWDAVREKTSLFQAFERLSANEPVIVMTANPDGNGGHATMLTHLSVRKRAGTGNVTEFRSASVYDPWPGQSTHAFSADDWRCTRFIAVIRKG
jgi:hypothetical protein